MELGLSKKDHFEILESLTFDKITGKLILTEIKELIGLDMSPETNYLYPAVSFLLPTATLTTHTKSDHPPKKQKQTS